MDNVKVLIVEDDAVIAEDLQDILENAGYEIVGIAHSAQKAIDILSIRPIDLVFLDVSLSDNSTGIDVANYINEHLNVPFVFLTSYSDAETVKSVVETNPGGYLVKPFKEKDILPAAVLAVANSKNISKDHFPDLDAINKKLNVNLTAQEFKVLFMIWEGKKNNEIAAELFLSVNTIKTHIRRIFSKMNVNSRVSAISIVFK